MQLLSYIFACLILSGSGMLENFDTVSSGVNVLLSRSSVRRKHCGNHSLTSSPSMIRTRASPVSQHLSIPYPLKPAAIHCSLSVALSVRDAGILPTTGRSSAVWPWVPDQIDSISAFSSLPQPLRNNFGRIVERAARASSGTYVSSEVRMFLRYAVSFPIHIREVKGFSCK